jgi:hypothetical protein
MKQVAMALTLVALVVSTLACGYTVNIEPSIEVGTMQNYSEEIPLDGTDEAEVVINFGAGELDISAGEAETLLAGDFRTNVEEWAPDVSWRNGTLRLEQGDEGSMDGIVEAGAVNEWDLEFSPEVELDMELRVGASQSTLDLSGLALTRFVLETGASEMSIRFNEPNPAAMSSLEVAAGAASLIVDEIGNAGPETVTVRGGAGNLILDLTGDWPGSSRIQIEAGIGALTLRVPQDIGVRIEVTEGLGSVQSDSGFSRSGGAYTNSAYGETEDELIIEVTVGVGSVNQELIGE